MLPRKMLEKSILLKPLQRTATLKRCDKITFPDLSDRLLSLSVGRPSYVIALRHLEVCQVLLCKHNSPMLLITNILDFNKHPYSHRRAKRWPVLPLFLIDIFRTVLWFGGCWVSAQAFKDTTQWQRKHKMRNIQGTTTRLQRRSNAEIVMKQWCEQQLSLKVQESNYIRPSMWYIFIRRGYTSPTCHNATQNNLGLSGGRSDEN